MNKWMDNYGKDENPNEGKSSGPSGSLFSGYTNKGRNYSPAWGGQFQMGGSLPGSVGFTYARTGAPSNGPHAKKTMASAQFGKVIKDNRGQWAYPGEITQIDGNNITMKNVDYPVIGLSDVGDLKLMKPGKDYKFRGNNVTEFPITKNGGNVRQEQKGKVNLDNLLNFTNYNTPQPGGWLDNL